MSGRTRVKTTEKFFSGRITVSDIFGGTEPSETPKVINTTHASVCTDNASTPYIPKPLDIQHFQPGCVVLDGSGTSALSSGAVLNTVIADTYPLQTVEFPPSFPFGVEAYSKVADILSKASPTQSSTDIGEILQSIYQLREFVTNLQRAFRGVYKRIRDFDIDMLQQSVGDLYIANQFGLKPMIDDLRLVAKFAQEIEFLFALQRKAENGTSIRVGLGTREQSHTISTWGGASLFRVYYDIERNYRDRQWATVTYYQSKGVKPPKRRDVKDNLGTVFGNDQPFVTFWNLIPWSFLVDYFVNTGSLIDALHSEYEAEWVCVMKQTDHTARIIPKRQEYLGFGFGLGQFTLSLRGEGAYRRRERVPIHRPIGVPALNLLGLTQITNIAALLASRIKK